MDLPCAVRVLAYLSFLDQQKIMLTLQFQMAACQPHTLRLPARQGAAAPDQQICTLVGDLIESTWFSCECCVLVSSG